MSAIRNIFVAGVDYIRRSRVRYFTLVSILAGIAGQCILIVSGILSARILGVENRGYLALFGIFSAVLTFAGSLGLPQSAAYYLTARPRKALSAVKRLWHAYRYQSFLLTILLVIILAFTLSRKSPELLLSSVFCLPVISGILAQSYGMSILQGMGKMLEYNVCRLIQPSLYSIFLVVIALHKETSLAMVTGGWVASFLLAGLGIAFFANRRLTSAKRDEGDAEDISLSEMVTFGAKGMLGSLQPMEAFRLDQLIAGLLLRPYDLGIYVVAKSISNLPRFIAQSIGIVTLPVVAGHRSFDKAYASMVKFTLFSLIVNICIAGILALLMPLLIPLLYGQDFHLSVPIARILILAVAVSSIRVILGEGLRGLGFPALSTYAELSLYAWLLPALPYFTHAYGLKGLAFSLLIGYILSLAVVLIATYRLKETGRTE